MNARKSGRAVAALIGLALFAPGLVRAANAQELVRETQRTSTDGGHLTMVWWMPQVFWEESLKANPALPEELRNQFLATLSDYTIVALLRASPGLAGLTDVQPKEELLKNTRVAIGGKTVEALAPESISPGAQLLLAQLKPALGSMAGQIGENLEFVVYPGKADGRFLLDAAKEGSFEVSLYEQTFTWRLPLGSVLPPKVDGKTGEQFPGNYNYNPYTGGRLEAKK